MRRRPLCRLDALGAGRLTVEIGPHDAVLLIRDGDELHAVDGHCPHQYAPLHDGELEAGILVCPHHGWRFDVRTGVSPDSPWLRVRRWPAWVEDGMVWIEHGDNEFAGA